MQARAVTEVAVPVAPACSTLLETQHSAVSSGHVPVHLLNNRSQINQSPVLPVYTKELHSTLMLVLWERRKDGVFLWG